MPLGLSFSGSGHLLCYHLGVARVLASNREWVFLSGASGGAVVACVTAALHPDDQRRFVTQYATRCRSLTGIRELLPDDAHMRAMSAGLHVQLTACETGQATMLSTFADRAELIDALFASCRIPRSFHPLDMLRGGAALKYPANEGKRVRGTPYVDGALSSLCPSPAVAGATTLKVCPLAALPSEFLICPEKPSTVGKGIPNIGLGHRTVGGLPLHACLSNLKLLQAGAFGAAPRELERLYDDGCADAERYLLSASEHGSAQ